MGLRRDHGTKSIGVIDFNGTVPGHRLEQEYYGSLFTRLEAILLRGQHLKCLRRILKVVLEVHYIMMAKTFDEKPGAQRNIVQKCQFTIHYSFVRVSP